MSTDQDRLRAYYARFDEWQRLESPEGALEFRRAMTVLEAHLPPRSRVLDLGGGPGRYTIELARRGHSVVLADLSRELLDVARRRIAEVGVAANVESIDQVNAVDLGRYADAQFDAAVVFGPFYHLLEWDERGAAASEIGRVLRPGGLAFVAVMPRLSGIMGLIQRAAMAPDQVPPGVLTEAATTGRFRNGSPLTGFQEGYYPGPGELEALFRNTGFEVLEVVSLRSIANRLESELRRLPQPLALEVDHLIERLGQEPAVVASGGHAVIVARRA
jgi:S-adenosylmethionine-dependent methyltransferase